MTKRARLSIPAFGGRAEKGCNSQSLDEQSEIIVADEPTSNPDEITEKQVMEIFRRLHGEGLSVIIVTPAQHWYQLRNKGF